MSSDDLSLSWALGGNSELCGCRGGREQSCLASAKFSVYYLEVAEMLRFPEFRSFLARNGSLVSDGIYLRACLVC
eukprot:1790893-Amphidinium_carterae.1